MMMKNKRTVYRHPVTNKFISKAEWESLQGVKQEFNGSDFDVDSKYIEETKKFMEKIEEVFDELVKTNPPSQEEDETPKPGWKFFFYKFKFWQ